MHLIGITGGISTGKSVVSQRFRELNYTVIDGDVVARQVMQPGQPAFEKVRAAFGPEVITESGELDRTALGNIVFNDESKRQLLNSLVHPEIIKRIVRLSLTFLLQRRSIVLLDLPLLYESGALVKYLTRVIAVSCKPEQQLQRLMNRSSLSEEDAAARIRCQMDLEEKCRRADFVVDNSGTLEETLKQVDQIEEVLRQKYCTWISRYLILDFICIIAGALIGYLIF